MGPRVTLRLPSLIRDWEISIELTPHPILIRRGG